MNAKSYFRNIFDNVTSIAIGMKITLKYCFQKTVTVQYPEQHLTFAPRYRGIHEFELDKCIACDLCAKACPVDCIYIDKTGARKIDKKTGKVDPKGGELVRYAIDYSKCLFCALCTEPCPTDCIHMGNNHDLSGYDRESMVVEFTDLAKQGLQTPMPIWGPDNVGRGGLQARDPKTNQIKWVKPGRGTGSTGGTMTTASNLVFQVAGTTLYAYKADTGDELLALPFNVPGGAPPITYMVDNTQYVGFATGTQFMAMKVGGTAQMPPAPPPGQFGRGGKGAPPPAAPPPAAPKPAEELHK